MDSERRPWWKLHPLTWLWLFLSTFSVAYLQFGSLEAFAYSLHRIGWLERPGWPFRIVIHSRLSDDARTIAANIVICLLLTVFSSGRIDVWLRHYSVGIKVPLRWTFAILGLLASYLVAMDEYARPFYISGLGSSVSNAVIHIGAVLAWLGVVDFISWLLTRERRGRND